jgi:hypothetical protein
MALCRFSSVVEHRFRLTEVEGSIPLNRHHFFIGTEVQGGEEQNHPGSTALHLLAVHHD